MYAADHADFGDALAPVWAVVSLTILLSIGVHGISASPLMHRLDRTRDEASATEATTADVIETKGHTS